MLEQIAHAPLPKTVKEALHFMTHIVEEVSYLATKLSTRQPFLAVALSEVEVLLSFDAIK